MILLILLALSQPPQIDCEMVRAKVAEYGRIRALIWAKQNGYSLAEINQARKCLRASQ